MAGATYVCGGDERPGARGTDCPNELHDHPLPAGYVDASNVAGRRISQGWSNRKCPDCDLHGWAPPPGERGTDCPNALHDHPLPGGSEVPYVTAARRRESAGWLKRACPDCGVHGWIPPRGND